MNRLNFALSKMNGLEKRGTSGTNESDLVLCRFEPGHRCGRGPARNIVDGDERPGRRRGELDDRRQRVKVDVEVANIVPLQVNRKL